MDRSAECVVDYDEKQKRATKKILNLPENVWTHLKVWCMMKLDKSRTAFAVKAILWKVRSLR